MFNQQKKKKNASLNTKPSGLIAIAQLIMCCKTINNNFRNLNYYLIKVFLRFREVVTGDV